MTVILKGKAVADVKKMGVEKSAPSSVKTAAKKKPEVKKEAEKND